MTNVDKTNPLFCLITLGYFNIAIHKKIITRDRYLIAKEMKKIVFLVKMKKFVYLRLCLTCKSKMVLHHAQVYFSAFLV